MKYFYDTEFLEGTQKRRLFGFKLPKMFDTKPTIDLISIGIVAEDGRKYYAVSKDFNLKEAWNRYDVEIQTFYGDLRNQFPKGRKQKKYWIRENVLKPIFYEWTAKDINFHDIDYLFTYKNFKKLLMKYGKSNKQIVKEIKNFCYLDKETKEGGGQFVSGSFIPNKYPNIELYGYYSAYDHVALCWLFGKMIDLPKGFPMYCKDLKQILDEKELLLKNEEGKLEIKGSFVEDIGAFECFHFDSLKEMPNYPKQENEHNALADARWNKKLYEFLQNI